MKYLSNPSVVKGLFTALLLLASSVARPQSANPDTPSYTMRSGGTERSYKLHLPQGLPQGAPLVVVLHGYGANNDPGRFGMNAAADRHGFAVCYPQGAKDGRGKTCWNVGYPFQADMAIDDVEFITQLVRHLQKKHGLSRRNVFCTGMSNGGEMCYQLAAQRPRLFAAVAPVSGLMLEWLYKADTSDVPVPLFEIHGTADRTSAWEGDPDNKGGALFGNYWTVDENLNGNVRALCDKMKPLLEKLYFLYGIDCRERGGLQGAVSYQKYIAVSAYRATISDDALEALRALDKAGINDSTFGGIENLPLRVEYYKLISNKLFSDVAANILDGLSTTAEKLTEDISALIDSRAKELYEKYSALFALPRPTVTESDYAEFLERIGKA